jgi:predicted NACHT family NTPase
MKGRMGEWENGGEEEERGGLRGIDLVRWEEELREERIAYEPHSLEEVFANFRRVAKDAKSDVPRFFVLGPPGSGKTTLAQYLAWACSGSRGESSNALGIGQLRFASGMTANLIPARVRLREWEAWATKPENPEHGLPQSCPI